MGKIPSRLGAGLLAACLLGAAAPAWSADAPASSPTFMLKDTFTGSVIGLDVVSAALPFDKTWAELTPQEQDVVRSDYESMPAQDEPPFPDHGLKRIALPIAKKAEFTHDEGPVIASVTVDAQGKPHDVTVYKSPSREITAVAAAELIDATYKPAVCKGQPCSMAFVLRLELLHPNGRPPGARINHEQ
jgi:hypothetical protein